MKKLIAVTLAVVLVVSAIAVIPVIAKTQPHGVRAMFECDIVPTSMGDTDMVNGEAWIRTGGQYKVEIEGVAAEDGTVYNVELHYGCGGPTTVVILNDITIYDGEGMCTGTLPGITGDVRCPRIRIFEDGGGPAQFTSGFETPWG
jgi:hypothetical protein